MTVTSELLELVTRNL